MTITYSPSSTTQAVLSNGVTSFTFDNTGITSGVPSSLRNRIINGAMVIDQRNAGASVTPTSGQYSVDRWTASLTQASKFSMQQNAGSVTPPTGFKTYLGITSLSSYSIASGDIFAFSQAIEGFNTADLGWGAAGAATVTLSFWVRSSLTGTFGGSIVNAAQNRSYPFSYTISAANTWEQKSITIAGDTTGTWVGATNGVGLYVFLGLGVGSTYSGTAGAWSGSTYYGATGATSVVGTNGATFYITGVQLEKGSTATSFEYRPYGTELALCQRYFWKAIENTGSVVMLGNGVVLSGQIIRVFLPLPVPMRALPTGTRTGIVYGYDGVNQQAIDGGSFGFSSTIGLAGDITSTAGGYTVGRGAVIYTGGGTGNNITASAEL